MAKKVALILSGCGYLDGAEINEAVLCNLALHREGCEVSFFAPDTNQLHVIDHETGQVSEGQVRNAKQEAARIARGNVKDTSALNVADFDAIAFPGGFGAAKNLSSFALKGAEMTVLGSIETIIRQANDAGKPLLFLCIAPVIAAKVISSGVEVTIGDNKDVAAAIESFGAIHIAKPVTECVVDKGHKVVTAPAYMYEAPIHHVEQGISAAVKEFVAMM